MPGRREMKLPIWVTVAINFFLRVPILRSPTRAMTWSNGKPDRSYITGRIRFGGTVMPAFANKLTDAQIEILIDYLATK